ncbi:MAG: hypothetical protein IPL05_03665 [Betaproteobacteria bacterium]|jgi:hypothetical protein|nr:hypothetical protein [Betaproteobacteria bacterium]
MLEAATAGGKRGMLGRRESAQTRFQFWPKFPVDRSNDENAKPPGQNRHEAKGKRREAKKHKKQKPSNVELTGAARLYRAASSDQRERG